MKELLNQEKLHFSGVVANNRMNRERGCLGGNSYQKDLSFDPIEFLERRLNGNETVAWLDLCCGTGRALIEAAGIISDKHSAVESVLSNLRIIGIDLAGMFREFPPELKHLQLMEIAIEDFEPAEKFDLITCVHGLHYIGDKLAVIQKAAGWLKADGTLLANLDLNNLKLAGKKSSNKTFASVLRRQGFIVENRKHLIILEGNRNLEFSSEYLGADDQAGPNYTKQAVVDSYYRIENATHFA